MFIKSVGGGSYGYGKRIWGQFHWQKFINVKSLYTIIMYHIKLSNVPNVPKKKSFLFSHPI